jgi:glycosyltransferase involved in cell wall biosynthesis
MPRLMIHVEGQTEEQFIKNLVMPYLYGIGYESVSVRILGNARLKLNRGGIQSWERVKNDIIKQLRTDRNCYSAIMVDYIGLFCLNKNHTTHNFPGKVLGYMVQAMPILGSVNAGNDLKEVVEEAGAGYIVEAGDDKAFLEKAVLLLDDENRKEIALKARGLLKDRFSLEKVSSGVLRVL